MRVTRIGEAINEEIETIYNLKGVYNSLYGQTKRNDKLPAAHGAMMKSVAGGVCHHRSAALQKPKKVHRFGSGQTFFLFRRTGYLTSTAELALAQW